MPVPIIDVHVHAMTADGSAAGARGDPPFAFNLPTREWPFHDPAEPWAHVFSRWQAAASGESTVWSPLTDGDLRDQTLAVMERWNIIGVLCGPPALVDEWRSAAPDRFIPAAGMAIGWTELSPDDIRRRHSEGKLAVLAEVTNQYAGVEPDDERFEPYLAVCEELDIPVGIHIGTGPPGAPYLPGLHAYRARLHSPLLLEEPLMRHPRLRIYVMHAGWPMLDDMLAVLWTHPRVCRHGCHRVRVAARRVPSLSSAGRDRPAPGRSDLTGSGMIRSHVARERSPESAPRQAPWCARC